MRISIFLFLKFLIGGDSRSDDEVIYAKKEIENFIASLGIAVSPELNAGKPELMLRKKMLQ